MLAIVRTDLKCMQGLVIDSCSDLGTYTKTERFLIQAPYAYIYQDQAKLTTSWK